MALRDLRDLPWSSIDNDESRDLDQLEVAVEASGKVRLLIAVADVDALVQKGSALDDHARTNTTSVYTTARIFPMLPEVLSTDRTSLNERRGSPGAGRRHGGQRRRHARRSGCVRAAVRNRAKLTYPAVAAWLDGTGQAPSAIAALPGLERSSARRIASPQRCARAGSRKARSISTAPRSGRSWAMGWSRSCASRRRTARAT